MTLNDLNKSVWKLCKNREEVWASERYPSIPDELKEYLCSFHKAETTDEKSWFLSSSDFIASNETEITFDEFENLSLVAAEDDEEWKSEIVNFWSNHVPLYISVNSGYEYIAYNLQTKEYVSGCEPVFEETTLVSKTLNEFIQYVNSKHT